MAGTFYRSPGPGEPPFVKVCKHLWSNVTDTGHNTADTDTSIVIIGKMKYFNVTKCDKA
jgi:hypothetical protein